MATANTSLQWPQTTLGSAAAAPTAAHSCALRVTGQFHCKRGVAHAAHLVAAVAVKLYDVLMELLQAGAVRDGEKRDAYVLGVLVHLPLAQHGDGARALVQYRVPAAARHCKSKRSARHINARMKQRKKWRSVHATHTTHQ